MKETITMTSREQQRAQVLTRLAVGKVTAGEAALLLGLSERPVLRLRAGYQRDGPAAAVHGNRGRASMRRREPALAGRVLGLARTTYSRASLRRLLRAAGQASPRRRRAPRHRSRRDRMPQAGRLRQVDPSRHGIPLGVPGAPHQVRDARGALS